MTDTTLNRFISSGTHAQRLLFTPVQATPASGPSPSAFWFETDTGQTYAWNFGSSVWALITAASASITTSMGITIDGGGSTITTGVKGDLFVPVACTITSAVLLADQAGSIVIDIWKAPIGSYPPTIANTIVAAAPPTLSTATNSTNSTLTGWTTAVSAGDTLRFNVNSATTLTRVSLALKITVP